MSAPCQNSFLLNDIHLDYVLRYHTFIVYQIFNFACSIFACQPVTLSTRANALEIKTSYNYIFADCSRQHSCSSQVSIVPLEQSVACCILEHTRFLLDSTHNLLDRVTWVLIEANLELKDSQTMIICRVFCWWKGLWAE